ncbi:TauD/TfdA family dioxygenase [Trujillonella humicola]|uniref:TauD/TfdA family dioxygenase n=1 Tax=Trujillonella humicola TaxID=3383699 RepID=UPI003905F745
MLRSSPPLSLPAPDLAPGRPAVLPAEAGGEPARWAAAHRAALRGLVAEHGAVVVRGLGLRDADDVAATFAAAAGTLVPEREAFAPREVRGPGVHGATPWPAGQQMCMHHELSYRLEVPGLLLFACLVAPAEGGATPLADAAAVLAALPPALVDRFEREGWLLVRTYGDDIGASWAEAFGTGDRAAVEAAGRADAIELEWLPDGGLRTRQRRRAVVPHPLTGARCWFNQVAFLSEWTLDPEVREYLVEEHGPDGLPFTTRFGGGDPVGEDVVALLTEVYDAHTVREPWQAGDLLLVDNVATAHAREPYRGAREVLVGLADPVRFTPPSGEGALR